MGRAAPGPAGGSSAADLTAAPEPADEALVARVRDGDDSALVVLLARYRPFARLKARSYFLVGADREDILQEGMVGLFKAVRDFDPGREASFRAFADLCITRQIITAVKTATRFKHGPLNSYVSLSKPVHTSEDRDRTLADLLPGQAVDDPADLIISADRIRSLQAHIDQVLSDLEVEVLRLYVEGRSYQEIAALLERQTKAVDNALQRVKRKLDCHLKARELAERG